MSEEELVGVLAAIIAPIVGPYLANVAAGWLYVQLSIVDQETLDDLLIRYSDLEEVE